MNSNIFPSRAWFVGALIVGLLLTGGGHAATVPVTISNFAFSPASVTIDVNDTVTWTQKDSTKHTSTSDAGAWASALLSLNQTFSHTFDAAGTFPYHCSPHPFMTGKVTVQAPAANQPPVISITKPANGTTVTDTNVVIEATATDPDGSIAKVEFFEARTSLGAVTASPFQITVSLAVGTHNLTAQATDNQGATATSAVVTITVAAQNSPPTVAITTPADGAQFTAPAVVSLAATANDSDGSISKVEFFNGDTLIGGANSSPFTFAWNDVPAGDYTVTAKATDNKGATTGSNPVHLHVSVATAVAPSLSIPARTTDGSFVFSVTGTVGKVYVVQASSDLKTWDVTQTLTAPADVFTVTNTPAATLDSQFYRVQINP